MSRTSPRAELRVVGAFALVAAGCDPPDHCLNSEYDFSLAPVSLRQAQLPPIDGEMVVTSTEPRLFLSSPLGVEAVSATHLPDLEVGARVHVRVVRGLFGYGGETNLVVLSDPDPPRAVFATYWRDHLPDGAAGDLPSGLGIRYQADEVCGAIGSSCGVSHTLEAEFTHDGQVTRVGRGKVVRSGDYLLGNGRSEDWEWGGECTDAYDAQRRSGFAIRTKR